MSLINQELSYLVFGLDVDLDVLGQRKSRLQVQLLVGHARSWELLKRQVELLTLARCRNEDSGFCDVTISGKRKGGGDNIWREQSFLKNVPARPLFVNFL